MDHERPSEHNLRSTAVRIFQIATIVRGGIGWMHDEMGPTYLLPYVMSYCKTVSMNAWKIQEVGIAGLNII
jgi:hypothetical protein